MHTVQVVRSLRSVLSIIGVLAVFLCSAAVTTAATTATTSIVVAVDDNNNHNSNPSASASTSSRSNQHVRKNNNDASRNLQTTAAPSQTFSPTTTFGPTETFSVSEIVYWNWLLFSVLFLLLTLVFFDFFVGEHLFTLKIPRSPGTKINIYSRPERSNPRPRPVGRPAPSDRPRPIHRPRPSGRPRRSNRASRAHRQTPGRRPFIPPGCRIRYPPPPRLVPPLVDRRLGRRPVIQRRYRPQKHPPNVRPIPQLNQEHPRYVITYKE